MPLYQKNVIQTNSEDTTGSFQKTDNDLFLDKSNSHSSNNNDIPEQRELKTLTAQQLEEMRLGSTRTLVEFSQIEARQFSGQSQYIHPINETMMRKDSEAEQDLLIRGRLDSQVSINEQDELKFSHYFPRLQSEAN